MAISVSDHCVRNLTSGVYKQRKLIMTLKHLKKDARRRKIEWDQENKTDWYGYLLVTVVALGFAYVVAHAVIGLNALMV